jgi:hypothetical protein
MSDVKDAQERAIRVALRDERARDAARALKEHEAKKEADLAKTARLRALRLAKTAEPTPQKRK